MYEAALTTTPDRNETGQRPIRPDPCGAASQASDGNRQRERTLQAEGQGFESPKLHSQKRPVSIGRNQALTRSPAPILTAVQAEPLPEPSQTDRLELGFELVDLVHSLLDLRVHGVLADAAHRPAHDFGAA
jgi:hypothetical protein